MFSRQRKYPRMQLCSVHQIELISFDHSERKEAMIMNSCEGGLLVKLHVTIPKRSFWMIRIFLFENQEPIFCKARVLHTSYYLGKETSYYTAGLRFQEISLEDQAKIRLFIQRQVPREQELLQKNMP